MVGTDLFDRPSCVAFVSPVREQSRFSFGGEHVLRSELNTGANTRNLTCTCKWRCG